MLRTASGVVIALVALCSVMVGAEQAQTCAEFFEAEGSWQQGCGCGRHPINKPTRVTCTTDCPSVCCTDDTWKNCQEWKDSLGACEVNWKFRKNLSRIHCSKVCRCSPTTCCALVSKKKARVGGLRSAVVKGDQNSGSSGFGYGQVQMPVRRQRAKANRRVAGRGAAKRAN